MNIFYLTKHNLCAILFDKPKETVMSTPSFDQVPGPLGVPALENFHTALLCRECGNLHAPLPVCPLMELVQGHNAKQDKKVPHGT